MPGQPQRAARNEPDADQRGDPPDPAQPGPGHLVRVQQRRVHHADDDAGDRDHAEVEQIEVGVRGLVRSGSQYYERELTDTNNLRTQ
jgi:hypothetical protein